MSSTLVEYILNLRGNLTPQVNSATSATNQLTGAMGTARGAALSLGSAMGIAFGVAGVAMFIKNVVTAGSVVEDATTGLTTLLKSSSAATQVIKNVMIDAMATPFEFKGLLAANKALISADETAEGAREAVYNLANAISATGGGNDELTRMVVNLQQIKNVGFASALDIKQFAYAGVNIYKALNEAGIKTGEGQRITYQQITKALKVAHAEGGIYYHGLENMAKNTSVVLSNVGDSLFQFMNNIYIEAKPLITAVLESALAGITKLNTAFAVSVKFVKDHKDAITWVIASYAAYKTITLSIIAIEKIHAGWIALKTAYQVAQFVATGNLTVAQWALNGAMYANPIGILIAGVAALVGGVIALTNHFGSFGNMLSAVWEMAKVVGNGIAGVFQGVGQAIMGVLTFDPAMVKSGVNAAVDAALDAKDRLGTIYGGMGAVKNAGANESLIPSAMNAKGKKGEPGAEGAMPKTKAEGAKNINIHIAYNAPLIQGFTISTTNVKEGIGSLKEKITAVLVNATHDSLIIADH